jgi:uncharacterized protein with GYD domain
LEKTKQKYFALIKMGIAGSGKIYDAIMHWKEKPLDGVKLQEAYQVFGEWDFAVLFEADTNDNALHFVGDMIRPLEGVSTTVTIPISPLKTYS